MCHLYLLYSARSLGLGNQFHKDTGLISAAVHIMRRALLLSSAELLARGHEQINRDVTQLPPLTCPPVNIKGGKVMLWGVHKEQNTQQGKGCDPCKVPLVMPYLQNFIISVFVCLIFRKLPSHLVSWVSICVCAYVCVYCTVMKPADSLSLIISNQTFIDQPQLHQSFALPSSSSGCPMSHLTTVGLILPKAVSVVVCTD